MEETLLTGLPIGGIQIEGLGATDIDNQPEVFNSTTLGGLALEFHRRISTFYNRLPRLEEVIAKNIKDAEVRRFESRVAEKVILDWLAEFDNITIIFVCTFPHREVVNYLMQHREAWLPQIL